MTEFLGLDGSVAGLAVVLACGLATYVWRGVGVFLSGQVRTSSAVFVWAGCVAQAMIAGLVVRVLLLPAGALAQTALIDRLLACAVALIVFFVPSRRNLLLGVGSGFAAMILLAWLRTAA